MYTTPTTTFTDLLFGTIGKWFAAVILVSACATAQAAPDTDRQQALLYLLKHDCGSCHGMTRSGGLGPSLLPDALEQRPDALLIAAVLDGRPGTAMPPWRGLLSEDDVRWLVDALREGAGL